MQAHEVPATWSGAAEYVAPSYAPLRGAQPDEARFSAQSSSAACWSMEPTTTAANLDLLPNSLAVWMGSPASAAVVATVPHSRVGTAMPLLPQAAWWDTRQVLDDGGQDVGKDLECMVDGCNTSGFRGVWECPKRKRDGKQFRARGPAPDRKVYGWFHTAEEAAAEYLRHNPDTNHRPPVERPRASRVEDPRRRAVADTVLDAQVDAMAAAEGLNLEVSASSSTGYAGVSSDPRLTQRPFEVHYRRRRIGFCRTAKEGALMRARAVRDVTIARYSEGSSTQNDQLQSWPGDRAHVGEMSNEHAQTAQLLLRFSSDEGAKRGSKQNSLPATEVPR